jgi:outer membrane protein assembly factor BamB
LIADGKVFLTVSNRGSYGARLYALDALTGAIAWGPIPLAGTYWFFPLAYDAGRIFVDNDDGTTWGFDAATGRQLWVRPYLSGGLAGIPVATAGVVWGRGSNGGVEGLSARTGAVVATSTPFGGGAWLAVDGTGVYGSQGCGAPYKVSLTGQVLWTIAPSCSGGASGATSLWRSRMYDPNGGLIYRKHDGTQAGSYTGTSAFWGTNGFFATGTSLFAEDVKTLTPLWTDTLSGQILAGPVTTSSAVWVATSSNKLLAVSLTSGRILSHLTLPGTPGSLFARTDPSGMNAGESMLIVPTGRIVTAYG